MKLAIVLMFALCLFLQTHARKIDDERYYEKLENDPAKCVYAGGFCTVGTRCCPQKHQMLYCIGFRCKAIGSNFNKDKFGGLFGKK